MKKKEIYHVLLIILFIILAIIPFHGFSFTQTKIDRIEAYLESELTNYHIPGMSIGIIKNKRIIYTNGFGRKDETGAPMTGQTPIYIGSITKGFTAMAILHLHESGKIQLNARVKDYLPWFKTSNESESAQISVLHLLYQISGISTEMGLKNLYGVIETSEEYVKNLNMEDLQSAPGTKFQYSNANYAILGLLVENRSGIALEKYIQRNIFDKLNMRFSTFSRDKAIENGLATGYRTFYGLHVPSNDIVNPAYKSASSIITTAEDLSKYAIAQLNVGRYGNFPPVLTPASMSKLHSPPDDFKGDTNYAMGWVSTTFDGIQVIRHSGALIDYHANIIIAPEHELGIIIIMNISNVYGLSLIANNVMKMLLEKPLKQGTNLLAFYITMAIIASLTIAIQLRSEISLIREVVGKQKVDKEKRKKIKKVNARIKIVIYLALGAFLLFGLPIIIGISYMGFPFTIFYILWGLPDLGIWLLISGIGGILAGILKLHQIRKKEELLI